jgi:hypothetical protein
MRNWINLCESTNSECNFMEVRPGEWWYLLDQWRPGYDDDGEEEEDHRWDWREDAIAEGPFKTFEEAQAHLRNNHANPGGYSKIEYHPDYKIDELLQSKMAEAGERKKHSYGGGHGFRRW